MKFASQLPAQAKPLGEKDRILLLLVRKVIGVLMTVLLLVTLALNCRVEPRFIEAVGLGVNVTIMDGSPDEPLLPLPQPRKLKLKAHISARAPAQGPSLLIRLIEPPRPIWRFGRKHRHVVPETLSLDAGLFFGQVEPFSGGERAAASDDREPAGEIPSVTLSDRRLSAAAGCLEVDA